MKKMILRIGILSLDIQGVKEKLCFLIIHCNPFLAYIWLQEISKALNAMRAHSHSYWLAYFCTTKSSPVLARERWQNNENSWEKKHILYICNLFVQTYKLQCFIFLSQTIDISNNSWWDKDYGTPRMYIFCKSPSSISYIEPTILLRHKTSKLPDGY